MKKCYDESEFSATWRPEYYFQVEHDIAEKSSLIFFLVVWCCGGGGGGGVCVFQ